MRSLDQSLVGWFCKLCTISNTNVAGSWVPTSSTKKKKKKDIYVDLFGFTRIVFIFVLQVLLVRGSSRAGFTWIKMLEWSLIYISLQKE